MGRLEFTEETEQAWAGIRPDEDLSALGAVQRLVWIGRLAEELLERAAISAGMRHRGDYEVLALIRRAEPDSLTPVEVAGRLLASASGLTGKLDRLEDQGLLERQSDPRDRRIVRLALTDDGRSKVDDLFTINLSMYRKILEGLGPDEQRTFDQFLVTILIRLDEMSGTRQPWNG